MTIQLHPSKFLYGVGTNVHKLEVYTVVAFPLMDILVVFVYKAHELLAQNQHCSVIAPQQICEKYFVLWVENCSLGIC